MGRTNWTLGAAAVAALSVLGCGVDKTKAISACDDPLMIDDLEDGDRFSCESGGRRGSWYIVDDGTSTNISPRGEFTPALIPGGRGVSRLAAHMTGFDFTDWGAALGFTLNGEGAAAQPYDASATGGVRFWMKTNVPVTVSFPLPETLSAGAIAACVDDTERWNCDNHFRFRIAAPTLGEWTEYDVPYAAAAQIPRLEPDGTTRTGTAAWKSSELVSVQFAVDAYQTFEVWIDDLRFYGCAGDACLPTCTDPGLPVACPATGSVPAGCWPAGRNCAKGVTADLNGVWANGPDDVWVTGYGGLILHWNASAWSSVPSPTTEWLGTLWGNGSNDIWSVGIGGAIVHWDGSSWSAVASGTTQPLYSIWSAGPADAWAVGGAGTILHWDGSSWSAVASGTSYVLSRVWGSGPGDVWVVGSAETGAGLVLHWDGAVWSVVPGAPTYARGLAGTGPDDVWVTAQGGAIVHWDGTSWSSVPSGTENALPAAAARAPNDAWAVGAKGTILHWDGTIWSLTPSGTSAQLFKVWAAGPNDAWVVGAKGTVLHWDGAAWTAVPVEIQ